MPVTRSNQTKPIATSKEAKRKTGVTKQIKLGFGKKNDHVSTPTTLYNILDKEFVFDFDPCPLHSDFDGLVCDWGLSNFVNPPYSNIGEFVRKAVSEMANGKTSVFLVPARTSSVYWHDLVLPNCCEIRFFKKGIVFKGYETRLPIALCIVVFKPGKKPITNQHIVTRKYTMYSIKNY